MGIRLKVEIKEIQEQLTSKSSEIWQSSSLRRGNDSVQPRLISNHKNVSIV